MQRWGRGHGMPGIVDEILGCTDEILGIRDDLGATKHKVYLLTRIWEGEEIGDGNPIDSISQILPTPYLIDFSHDLRIREGGKIKQGDLMLKHISKQSYPSEKMIDCSVSDRKTEKFYYIDNQIYEVISVHEDYVYWNVQVRKTIKKKKYL